MNQESIERRLLIEQTRKELLDELLKYKVGVLSEGQMWATKTCDYQGYMFVIPDSKYKELFK
jgi:hypothetical protein